MGFGFRISGFIHGVFRRWGSFGAVRAFRRSFMGFVFAANETVETTLETI